MTRCSGVASASSATTRRPPTSRPSSSGWASSRRATTARTSRSSRSVRRDSTGVGATLSAGGSPLVARRDWIPIVPTATNGVAVKAELKDVPTVFAGRWRDSSVALDPALFKGKIAVFTSSAAGAGLVAGGRGGARVLRCDSVPDKFGADAAARVEAAVAPTAPPAAGGRGGGRGGAGGGAARDRAGAGRGGGRDPDRHDRFDAAGCGERRVQRARVDAVRRARAARPARSAPGRSRRRPPRGSSASRSSSSRSARRDRRYPRRGATTGTCRRRRHET